MKKLKIISIVCIFLITNNLPLSACSTFMINNGKNFLIGHNLDMYPDIPGMIFINKRGLEKESVSFVELFDGVADTLPKLKWVSKYGSVTYNPIGRELIDGGLNEAGLYIGEMGTTNCKYAVSSNKPKIAVALWMQYILDNFASIEEVVKSASEVTIDGKYMFNWHFFVADKKGNQAIIEFINGKTVAYQNNEIPIKLLCNTPYADDLNRLKQYKGFGGNKDIELKNKSEENRFIHGAQMLEFIKRNPADSDVNYAFDILKQLDFGPTKWSIVYDVKNMKMYYRTNKGINIKRIDFSSFDFSCKEPVMMLDINKDLPSGDVIEYFIPYTKQANKVQLEKALMVMGMKEEKTFPEMIERFANYPETVKCK